MSWRRGCGTSCASDECDDRAEVGRFFALWSAEGPSQIGRLGVPGDVERVADDLVSPSLGDLCAADDVLQARDLLDRLAPERPTFVEHPDGEGNRSIRLLVEGATALGAPVLFAPTDAPVHLTPPEPLNQLLFGDGRALPLAAGVDIPPPFWG